MDYAVYALYAGAVLHSGWAVFHMLFARIFRWQEALPKLDPINQRIYPILNICLTFYFMAAAYLEVRFTHDLLTTPLGRKLVALFTAFWLLRLGLQFRFFRGLHPVSLLLSALFLLTLGVHAYALLHGAG